MIPFTGTFGGALVIRREEIERILHDELERARSFYESQTDKFRTATEEMVPVDANHPDRTPAIRGAGTKRRDALAIYSLALKRFNDFIIHGIVPDDLK